MNRLGKVNCPACGSNKAICVDAKFLGLTILLQCDECHLRYRFPRDSEKFNFQFYQDAYIQAGLTTELPGDEELSLLMKTNFKNSEKDFSVYFPLLEKLSTDLSRKIHVFDYGANWGYTCYQFSKLNYVQDAIGYELSEPRRAFGSAKLGIKYMEASRLPNNVDVFFSSHVIEHMSDPSLIETLASETLAPNGIIILACPNGSDSARPFSENWSKLWGEVHPNYISDKYLCNLFAGYNGIIIDQENFAIAPALRSFNSPGIKTTQPITGNLLLIAQKNS